MRFLKQGQFAWNKLVCSMCRPNTWEGKSVCGRSERPQIEHGRARRTASFQEFQRSVTGGPKC